MYVKYRPRGLSKEELVKWLTENRATRDDTKGCLLYPGTSEGYGNVLFNGRLCRVHILAYEVATGTEVNTDEGEQVCHTCDTPKCFEAQHLFLGDASSNAIDAMNKGRLPRLFPHGEENVGCKLSTATVMEIKAQYSTGRFTQGDLHRIHNVSRATISMILRGKRRAIS